MLEWQKLPRGSYHLTVNDLTADVFKIGGEGWRWNVSNNSGRYLGYEKCIASLDLACEAALRFFAALSWITLTHSRRTAPSARN